MSRNARVKFIGDSKKHQYTGGGIDDGKDYPIECQQGDIVFVTDEKKAELLKDHGNWFIDPDKVSEPPKVVESPPEPVVVNTEPVIEPDYDSMTNSELRKLAGTDNKRLSKRKLIEMIQSKSKE
jgi:hypothetical protein